MTALWAGAGSRTSSWPKRRRRIGFLSGGVAIVLALAACGGGSSGSSSSSSGAASGAASSGAGSTGKAGQAVTVPLSAPLAVIDPTVDVFAGNAVYQALFQSLVYTSAPTGPVPDLAKTWDTSADGLTWTFHLDATAKFSDGTAVTSADVLYTIQKEMTAGSPYVATLSNVASVSAPDPETFIFQLKAPNAAFLTVGASKYIVPAAYYQKVGADGFNKAPMGSGPFKFDSAVAGGGAVVVATATYTRVKQQQYSKITYTPVPSAQAQVSGLQSGDLSVVANLASAQVDQLKSDSNIVVNEVTGGALSFIAFDTTMAPTDNVSFRKAVSDAIDRASMVKTIMNGHATIATGFVTPPLFGYDSSRKAPAFDVAQAKKEVTASGYTGQSVDLTYPTSVLVNADLVAQAVAAFLGDVGIKVNLIPLDYTTFLQKWVSHGLHGMYLMQYSNGADPDPILQSLAAANSRAMFTDQAVADQLQATRTTSGDARKAAIAKLQDSLFTTDVYYTPLMVPNAIYGVRKGIPFTANPIVATYITYKN
jgi:peptide/nickel transport system substrate-binding protein